MVGGFFVCTVYYSVYFQSKRASQLALQRSFCWCGRWDSNPHVMDTRTSNVPVCRFQHFRLQVNCKGYFSTGSAQKSSPPLHLFYKLRLSGAKQRPWAVPPKRQRRKSFPTRPQKHGRRFYRAAKGSRRNPYRGLPPAPVRCIFRCRYASGRAPTQ